MRILSRGIWALWLVLAAIVTLVWLFWPVRVAEAITVAGTLVAALSKLLTVPERLSVDAAVKRLHDEAKYRVQLEANDRHLMEPNQFTVPWTMRGAAHYTDSPQDRSRPGAAEQREPGSGKKKGPGWPARKTKKKEAEAGKQESVPIVRQYDAIDSGRLLVLGHEGAGKTGLLLQLVAYLLEEKRSTIPVLLEITHWDGVQRLDDWLADQLTEMYPALARPCDGYGRAADRLIRNDDVRILAVLDAVDELRDDRLTSLAGQLNGKFRNIGVVVAGRTDRLSEADFRLDRAAILTIDPLRGPKQAELIRWLGVDASWTPVLDRLDEDDTGRLADLLSTPSMVRLAVTVYPRAPQTLLHKADRPDNLNRGAAARIRGELLDRYPAAAFRFDQSPDLDHTRARRLTRQLAFLARHLRAADRYDLGWWELADRTEQRVIRGVAAALFWSVAAAPLMRELVVPWHAGALLTAWVPPLLVAFLTVYAILPRPSQYTRLEPGVDALALRVALAAGCILLAVECTVVLRVAGWDAAVSSVGPMLVLYLAVVIIANLPVRLSTWAGDRIAPDVSQPVAVLRRERARTLLLAAFWLPVLVSTCMFSLLNGTGLAVPGRVAIAVGMCGWLVLCYTAWGRLAIVRVTLALAGRTPLRLIRFLDVARDKGVLRQRGGRYEFWHADLQRRLAGQPIDAAWYRAAPAEDASVAPPAPDDVSR